MNGCSIAAGFFISFPRRKETKQRRVVEDYVRKKFAVCTFLPTPVSVSAKQKELASLKQLFLLNGKEQKFLNASPLHAGRGPFKRLTHRFAVGVDVSVVCRILPLNILSSRGALRRRISCTSTCVNLMFSLLCVPEILPPLWSSG